MFCLCKTLQYFYFFFSNVGSPIFSKQIPAVIYVASSETGMVTLIRRCNKTIINGTSAIVFKFLLDMSLFAILIDTCCHKKTLLFNFHVYFNSHHRDFRSSQFAPDFIYSACMLYLICIMGNVGFDLWWCWSGCSLNTSTIEELLIF